jgi:hypothetical protein
MASFVRPKKFLYVHLWIASLLLVLTPTSCPPESISGAGCPQTMIGFQLYRPVRAQRHTPLYSLQRKHNALCCVCCCPTNPKWMGCAGNQSLNLRDDWITSHRDIHDDVMEIIIRNIQDYIIIVPSKLTIETWNLKTEENDGLMKIYAFAKLPATFQGVNMT